MKEIKMTDRMGELTAAQIDHLAKGLELAHGLTLRPAGGGRVWLAHVEGGALLVMPDRTVEQIWKAAEIISQTADEYEAEGAMNDQKQN